MRQKIYQVDAFTTEVFKGNPAGVCVLPEGREDSWLQNVASEMNLSETAFVLRENGDWRLRWFTPSQEMYLCGHATLSTAHILWERGFLPKGTEARFHTLSGLLTVKQEGDWMEMDFPAWIAEPKEVSQELTDVVGVPVSWFGRNEHFGMAVVETPEQVRQLQPKFHQLREMPMDGLIVTAQGDGHPYDFVSRVFGPKLGIDEDPVTGGAHCMLTPYWAEQLGKPSLHAYQASKRGGELRVTAKGDRVALGGQAVTVFEAELLQ